MIRTDRTRSTRRRGLPVALSAVALGLGLATLAGCTNRDALPPVFGAVFGLTGAPIRPFTEGRLPEIVVDPSSRLVGSAAANPGSCIWQDVAGRRFRAACPDGSDGTKPRS